MKETMQLLKADVRGRVQTPRARREQLVEGFAESGLSAMAYAKLCGVNYSTFAGWLQRGRERRAGKERPALVEVKVAPTAVEAAVPLSLHLPGGARVELTTGEQLPMVAALLRALAGGEAC